MKDFFRNNGILLLVAAVLLAAVTALASFFLQGTANPLAGLVGVVSTPVRSGLNAAITWLEGRYDYAFRYEQLLEQNEQLKKRVAEMEEEIRQARAANEEVERYRNLLGLAQKRRDFVFESATITAIGPSNWESTFTLSKGEKEGLAPQQCVVDEFGNLVGIVTTVGYNWATVTALVDTATEMGGLIGRTDTAAILEGDFALMGEGRVKLTYIPESSDLIAGDEILTSGKGGVYPSGLVIGAVEQVHTDPSGLSRYAIVQPAADLGSLRQVFVIKEFNVVE